MAVSYYHHAMKWGNVPDDYPMEDFIPRFIRAEFDRKWGSWADNVLSWLYMRETTPSFLLLRYEDMKKNTVAELERVANFLERARVTGVNADPKRLQRAVELSSPERMRELEKTAIEIVGPDETDPARQAVRAKRDIWRMEVCIEPRVSRAS